MAVEECKVLTINTMMKTQVLVTLMMAGAVVASADELDNWRELMKRSNAVFSPHEAVEYGNAEQLQKAVEKQAAFINTVDELGNTPLHLAAVAGKAEAVRVLLAAGADVAAKDAAGRTAKELASHADVIAALEAAEKVRTLEIQLASDIRNGNAEAVKQALQNGVNPNAMNADNSGTLLCVAVSANRAAMAEILIQAGADVNYVTNNKKSVLHLAAVSARAEVIKTLLAAGANPMHPGNNGATPLHDAVWSRNSAAVEALIPAYKAENFNPDGGRNGYPVGMAIMGNRADYLQMFLNAGMKVNDYRFRKSPLLHMAVRAKSPFMVKTLLDAGADRNAVDAQGKKAAEYAEGECAALLK